MLTTTPRLTARSRRSSGTTLYGVRSAPSPRRPFAGWGTSTARRRRS